MQTKYNIHDTVEFSDDARVTVAWIISIMIHEDKTISYELDDGDRFYSVFEDEIIRKIEDEEEKA